MISSHALRWRRAASALLLQSSTGLFSRASSSAVGEGIVEIRDYTIKPERFNEYIDLAAVASEVRTKHMPFLGMCTPETGDVLNRIVHFYNYESLYERERCRKAMIDRQQWTEFLQRSRPLVVGPQKSRILKEAAPVYEALDMKPTGSFTPPDDGIKGMYEIREYQLVPGYSTVPTVVVELAKGLPHKVAATPGCAPVFFGYVEIGTLNTFIELWRHSSSQACLDCRAASRDVPEWSEAIKNISPLVQTFKCELLRPVWYSPWQ